MKGAGLSRFEVCLYIGDAGSWEVRTTVYAESRDQAIDLVRKKVDRLWLTTARVEFKQCKATALQLLA